MPKHFHLYLKDMPLEIQTLSQGMMKENLNIFFQLFSQKPPKKMQKYVSHVREA